MGLGRFCGPIYTNASFFRRFRDRISFFFFSRNFSKLASCTLPTVTTNRTSVLVFLRATDNGGTEFVFSLIDSNNALCARFVFALRGTSLSVQCIFYNNNMVVVVARYYTRYRVRQRLHTTNRI